MAQVANVLVDQLLRRVRDTAGLAHSRTFVRDRLSDSQRLINLGLRVVLDRATIYTSPFQSFYNINGLLGESARVVGVQENGRDLYHAPDLQAFRHLNTRWFRSIGGRFEGWTQLGHDLMALYPCKSEVSSVTVISVKLTQALSGEGSTTDLPDEYLESVLSLAEVMLLLKQRDLESAAQRMTQLMQVLAPDLTAPRLHVAKDTPQ